MSRRDDDTGAGEPAPQIERIEPDAIEALERSVNREPIAYEDGRRVRLFISPKDFLPNRDPLWATQTMAAQLKGTVLDLGVLTGWITSTETKENEWQGKKLTSIWLNGYFEGLVSATGEILTAPVAILPRAYGKQIENTFKDLGATRAELDVIIGLEATGRNIVYEYVVRDYAMTNAQKAVAAMRERGQARLARSTTKALPSS